jgi:S-formylglutathione hydrolase FrmB
MALIECDFFSDVLGLSTSMTVILPQRTTAQIGMTGAVGEGDPPVLYLLHGLSDDHTIWLRRTSIERYVAPLGLAVVMPQVHRSFYADEHHGNRYWTFLSEELPALVDGFFKVSTRREDTFVAGLSMGGYGALRWALHQPERFAAAASLSGALDVAVMRHLDGPDGLNGLVHRVFGPDELRGSDHDLFALAERGVAGGVDLPAIFLGCGESDPLVGATHGFSGALDEHGVGHRTDIGPGGHEWDYWDRTIQDVLAWLPLVSRTP